MASSSRCSLQSNKITDMSTICGGITFDGVKIEETGNKYCDFLLTFIEIGREDHSTKRKMWKISCKLMFIARCTGLETAQSICEMINMSLIPFDTSNGKLKELFTLVTDCAATMPAVFGASALPNRVPYSERWVRHISKQLNTAMKNAFEDVSDKHSCADLKKCKHLISIFKKSDLNEELQNGKSLQQELSRRFGTTLETVQRFIDAEPFSVNVIESPDQDSTKNASDALDSIAFENSKYPSINSIITSIQVIRQSQTMLEAADTPTLMMVFPMIEELKKKMPMNGGLQSPHFDAIMIFDQALASSTLHALDKNNLS